MKLQSRGVKKIRRKLPHTLFPGFLSSGCSELRLTCSNMLSKQIFIAALCLGHVVLSLAQKCTTSLYSGNRTVCVDPCTDADVVWDRHGESAHMQGVACLGDANQVQQESNFVLHMLCCPSSRAGVPECLLTSAGGAIW
jgi:hypothetical protein